MKMPNKEQVQRLREIVMVSESGMDSDEQQEAYDRLYEYDFYRLPEQSELNVYHTMATFLKTLPSPTRDRLVIAISGRGAFQRFKDAIRRHGVEKTDISTRKNLSGIYIEWREKRG